ncbi:hypothetical protein L3Y34_006375 [Caenorhabditis briggsae]|uniref:7TM GPCR serpentine receptor class x (Srx) domain-containing protein n=1 Tax=Caenorhabditis briggsae TaxID=6238 RepID=A0AAE9CYT5_CAEBR|nr:hypothetical protein L3Y34_006375 [Caenorhabditis briggsae]
MDDFSQTAFALFPMSLLGFFTNWFVFQSLLRLRSFRHSFGYLSVSQSLADAIHSTAFLFFFCPMILLNQPLLQRNANHLSIIILRCYELSLYTHLAISINRVCAQIIVQSIIFVLELSSYFFIPQLTNDPTVFFFSTTFAYCTVHVLDGVCMIVIYPDISVKHTCWMICTIWILLGSSNGFLFVYVCQIKYDDKRRAIAFTATELCGNVAWYGDFLKNSIVVCIFIIIDIVTVIKVRKVRLFAAGNRNKNNESISEREKRFLKQTISQGTIFMVELITWFSIAKITSNQVIIFLLSGYAFIAVHVLDGIIVLLLNPEIRTFLRRTKNKSMVNLVNTSVAKTG